MVIPASLHPHRRDPAALTGMCYPDSTIHQYIHTLSDIGGGSIVINYIFTLVEIALDCSAAHVTQSEIWGDPLRARTSLSESESEGIHGHSPHRVARFFFCFFCAFTHSGCGCAAESPLQSPSLSAERLSARVQQHISLQFHRPESLKSQSGANREIFPRSEAQKKRGKKSKFVDRVEGRLSDALSASLLQSICFLLLVMQIK